MKYIQYFFLRFIMGLLSILPFSLVYLFSDFLSFMLKNFGYRKKVIDDNLSRVFPEKSDEERREIANKFYKNIADVMLETLKGHSLSEAEMTKRYKFVNLHHFQDLYHQGRSGIIVAGHQANWEWSVFATAYQTDLENHTLYMPFRNTVIDSFFKRNRETHGVHLHSVKNTKEVFKIAEEHPSIIVFAADQSPSNLRDAYRFDFLGQDSLVIHGPEKYARAQKMPVLYGNVVRIKRGHYEVALDSICDDPSELREGEICYEFMRRLERDVRAIPENYLWSHRRWKHDPERGGNAKIFFD